MNLKTLLLVILLASFHCATTSQENPIEEDFAPFENSSRESNSSQESCPEVYQDNYKEIGDTCKFWIQGIFLSSIGIFGLLGNALSFYVLTRPTMISTFNLILACISAIDTFYLIIAMIEYSLVQTFELLVNVDYDWIMVRLLYPMLHTMMVSSVFLHVVLAFERYLAVCHPEKIYQPRNRQSQRFGIEENGAPTPRLPQYAVNTIKKKVRRYIIPVFTCSFIINLPRWFELKLGERIYGDDGDLIPIPANSTLEEDVEVVTIVEATWLRLNDDYINYYMHWTVFFTTGLFPLAALLYLNFRVYNGIKAVRESRPSSARRNRQEPNYGATLASIIIVFVICHMPRIGKSIYEIVYINSIMPNGCEGIAFPSRCWAHVTNLAVVVNASSGFLIYCFVGSLGKSFIKVLKDLFCCRNTTISVQRTGDRELSRPIQMAAPIEVDNDRMDIVINVSSNGKEELEVIVEKHPNEGSWSSPENSETRHFTSPEPRYLETAL